MTAWSTNATTARAGLGHGTRIVCLGYAYPSRIVDNDTFVRLASFPLPDADELARRSGMKTRRWCGDGENSWTLARDAAERALAAAPGWRDKVDIVLATSSTTMPVIHPPESERAGHADLSTLVVRDVLRRPCLALDLKACYCTGFLRAVQVADAMLANRNYRSALIVCSEQSSRMATGPGNRSSFAFIAGDAAGAVLLERTAGLDSGLIDYTGVTDPRWLDLVGIGADGLSMIMKGSAAADAVLDACVTSARQLLARNGIGVDELDWFIPIQAHRGVVDALASTLQVPDRKILWNGDTTGFSGSASIPSALAVRVADDTVRRGDLILSVAAGAGVNSASALYRY